MSTTTQLFTAEQLLRLPDDGSRRELVEGVLTKMPPTGFEHGAVTVNLTFLLTAHVRAGNLGVVLAAETGFKLASNPDTVLAADISFVRREEVERIGPTRKFWPGAPDLAVEVMSPDDGMRRTNEKAQMWLDHGARLVWAVNPKRREVYAYRPGEEVLVLSENDTLDGGEIVPGFRCRVGEIFA